MLYRTQYGVQYQHRDDDNRAFPAACYGGNYSRCNQYHDKQIRELLRKYSQKPFPLPFLQPVFAVFFQPCRRFTAAQPLPAAFQQGKKFFFFLCPKFFHFFSSFFCATKKDFHCTKITLYNKSLAFLEQPKGF